MRWNTRDPAVRLSATEPSSGGPLQSGQPAAFKGPDEKTYNLDFLPHHILLWGDRLYFKSTGPAPHSFRIVDGKLPQALADWTSPPAACGTDDEAASA